MGRCERGWMDGWLGGWVGPSFQLMGHDGCMEQGASNGQKAREMQRNARGDAAEGRGREGKRKRRNRRGSREVAMKGTGEVAGR
eukprot:746152-Hanusia_phi.AAC.6